MVAKVQALNEQNIRTDGKTDEIPITNAATSVKDVIVIETAASANVWLSLVGTSSSGLVCLHTFNMTNVSSTPIAER